MKKSSIYCVYLLFTFLFSPVIFGEFDQEFSATPPFMRGWSEQQIQEYYKQQQKTKRNSESQMKDQMQEQRRNQVTKSVFRRMNSKIDKKLEKARVLREKAMANKKIGFGKVQLKIQGPDLLQKRVISLSMGMDLGTKVHRFACYSQDASEIAFAAKANISGYVQDITIKVKNIQGKKYTQKEVLEIHAKKAGRIDFKIEVPGRYFKRYGFRGGGYIKILGYQKGTSKVSNGSWVEYKGCALNQGPQNGGNDGGGYGNY